MKIIDEFKEFAMKGNVVDMGVGIIIGASFGKIVTSFVNDILMPPLGLLLGGVDFADKVVVLKEASGDLAAVTLNYGMFINVVLDFVIVAFAIFMVIKWMNKLQKEEPTEEEGPAPVSKDIQLLTEIRDSLKR